MRTAGDDRADGEFDLARLRHSLAAVVANAEFLCESNLTPGSAKIFTPRYGLRQPDDDLLESLLEFSRTRESVRPSYGDVRSASIAPCRGSRRIRIQPYGFTFPRRLDRRLVRFQKAGARVAELVAKRVRSVRRKPEDRDWVAPSGESLEIRIEDNGPELRRCARHLFEPFVSHAKKWNRHGIDRGAKICRITGGDVIVEQTSAKGTTFRVKIPLNPATENSLAVRHTG